MDCPDEDTYASFLQGLLPPERVAALERHIDVCARCTELSAQFGKLYSDDPPPASAAPPTIVTAPASAALPTIVAAPASAAPLASDAPSPARIPRGVVLVEGLLAALHLAWTLMAWPAALAAWLAGPLSSLGMAGERAPGTAAPLALAGAAYVLVWVPAGGALALAAALGLWRRRRWGGRLARMHALLSLPSIVLTPLAAYVLHQLGRRAL